MCLYTSLCLYVHVRAGVLRDQKNALDALVLELQVVVSHLILELGIKCESSLRSNS